jgi:hypothetical protein
MRVGTIADAQAPAKPTVVAAPTNHPFARPFTSAGCRRDERREAGSVS